jgi:hypothetical protein
MKAKSEVAMERFLVGFKNFQHLRLADMRFEKGKTRVTAARIREVAAKGAELLACSRP